MIANLSNLRMLGLENVRVTPNQFTKLGRLNLDRLDITNSRISSKGMLAIAKSHPSLIYLEVSRNRIKDKGCLSIAEKLNNLIMIDLSDNDIGPNGAKAIVMGMPHLIRLNIKANGVENENALNIGSNLPNLKYLMADKICIGNMNKHLEIPGTMQENYRLLSDY